MSLYRLGYRTYILVEIFRTFTPKEMGAVNVMNYGMANRKMS